jgi:hypothetical protein
MNTGQVVGALEPLNSGMNPCQNPDCNGKAQIQTAFGDRVQIVCTSCGTAGPMANTGEKAVQLWNEIYFARDVVVSRRVARMAAGICCSVGYWEVARELLEMDPDGARRIIDLPGAPKMGAGE